ncbi:hypothetical protein X975_17954, partial [Stegodyphus mimosarum]
MERRRSRFQRLPITRLLLPLFQATLFWYSIKPNKYSA